VKMLTVREQAALGGRILRWMFWPPHQKAWANTADLVIMAAVFVSISAQIWLGLLAGFFLWFAVGFAGRKTKGD
jgi:hypothetical protein